MVDAYSLPSFVYVQVVRYYEVNVLYIWYDNLNTDCMQKFCYYAYLLFDNC